MSTDFDRSEERAEPEGSPDASLQGVDPDLTIFALANGLDLFRNRSASANRVLEWYRDGMDRSIEIEEESPGDVRVSACATRSVDGVSRQARQTLAEGLTKEALRERLRAVLAEGLERANALTVDDVQPRE